MSDYNQQKIPFRGGNIWGQTSDWGRGFLYGRPAGLELLSPHLCIHVYILLLLV